MDDLEKGEFVLFGAAVLIARRGRGPDPRTSPYRPPAWSLLIGELVHVVQTWWARLERLVDAPDDNEGPL